MKAVVHPGSFASFLQDMQNAKCYLQNVIGKYYLLNVKCEIQNVKKQYAKCNLSKAAMAQRKQQIEICN